MPLSKKGTDNAPTIQDIPQLFSVLNEDEQAFLMDHHTTLHYGKNDIIYQEGEKPNGLLCLGSGKVKIFKEGMGARKQIVRMAGAPGFMGYRALFSDEAHIASAVVIEDCIVFHVAKDALFKLLSSNNQLCMNFIRSFATELGFSRYRTVTLTQKHIRGRLAESLIFLRDIYGYEGDQCTLNIYLSRGDLANFSNMTTSNAIRTLSTFVNEKVIAIDGKIIRIIDEEKLERISKLG